MLSCVAGFFQGMFERNLPTFNPGWDGDANKLPAFTDIRDLQCALRHTALRCSAKRTKLRPGRRA